MDEPFSSLDASTREDLQRLTVELRQETDVTTVIVTHNIEEAVYLGQRILVLGRAPNTGARIIENPGAGSPGFRSQPAYCPEVQRAARCSGRRVNLRPMHRRCADVMCSWLR